MKKRIVYLLFVLAVSYACTNTSKTNRKEKIRVFWQWFDSHKQEYASLTADNQEAKINTLLEKLQEIEPGLSVELSAEVQEIVISAEGDTAKFALVEEIVGSAPPLDEWDVTAFRQPRQEDFTLQYGDIELTPSELYFLPIEENEQLDIIVYGLNFRQYNYNKLAHYGMIMMDKVMGEYNAATKVRYYEFKDLEEAKHSDDLIPLLQINDYIEAYHADPKEKNI
jgi:hypothetical protein